MLSLYYGNGIILSSPQKSLKKSKRTMLEIEISMFTLGIPKTNKFQDIPQYHHLPVVAYTPIAEFINQYLQKGDFVNIVAIPQTRNFTYNPTKKKDKQTLKKIKIPNFNISQIEILGRNMLNKPISIFSEMIVQGVMLKEPKRIYTKLKKNGEDVELSTFSLGVKNHFGDNYSIFNFEAWNDIANMINSNFHKNDFVSIVAFPKEAIYNFDSNGNYKNPNAYYKQIIFQVVSISLISHFPQSFSTKQIAASPILENIYSEDFFI